MKKNFTVVFFFITILIGSSFQVRGQQRSMEGKPVICYEGDFKGKSSIINPAFLNKALRSNESKTSTIEVNYHGFPQEAEAAFQRAVDIWEFILISEVPIRVEAYWENLGFGTLGSASPGVLYTNFKGAPEINTWFPVALAEKISREELNGEDSPDISARFNNTTDWYFNTDGKPSSTQFDLTTVVLHEIGHGLGFSASMNVDNNQGNWGLNGLPFIYDRFLSHNGEFLIDTLRINNPSTKLENALTSE
ncbi:hypothetical protein E1171_00935, partial [Cytophagales bacterium RKSG123]|nr:hypothetical protein [Xanthovirga aplysinae]